MARTRLWGASVVAWPVALFCSLKPPRRDHIYSTSLSWSEVFLECETFATLVLDSFLDNTLDNLNLYTFLCCYTSVSFGIEVALTSFEFFDLKFKS